MKPLSADTQESESLQALGRASVQIVHDLKNQINGLKLYATFLRKRLEKTERPTDELETVNKLIGGLDRTAADLTMIVKYGQPISLRKQTGVDLQKLIGSVTGKLNATPLTTGSLTRKVLTTSQPGILTGQFDPDALGEALEWITLGAIKALATRPTDTPLQINLKNDQMAPGREGVIEWLGLDASSHDPFNSFVGSDGVKMSFAARVVEAHGGTAERSGTMWLVRLPLTT